jgi:transglutaminase-like putative cysteine protease
MKPINLHQRKFLGIVLFCQLILILCGKNLLSSESQYKIQPPDSWVEVISSDKTSTTLETEISNGIYWALLDYQTKIDDKTISYFFHVTKKIINHDGIANAANINVDFNPLKNKVILHQVTVRRGNQVLNRLLPNNIKTLQREPKLERQLYTGRKSIHLFLEDIRVGDIIDYSYTMIDTYTNLSHRFFYDIYLSNSYPMHELRERLVVPKKMELSFRQHATKISPHIEESNEYYEYKWCLKNISAVKVEDNIPQDFTPFPWIEIREKKSWNDIACDGAKLYEGSPNLSKDLDQYIKNLSLKNQTIEKQVIDIIRFVQDDVRYMGIANLEMSAPADPSVIFQRRFGDCKDKTMLALTILRSLGIKAYAVYVDTDKKDLENLLPSLGVFDHVILLICIGNKKYFIDPTYSFQRGSLENLIQPDFGYALVLNSKTNNLIKMPPHISSKNFQSIEETFDLRHENKKPALFSIKTILKGASADAQREYLRTTKKSDLQDYYLKYYKHFYPGIQKHKELTIHDDEEINQIEIVETYAINKPWIQDESTKKWTFNYREEEVNKYIQDKTDLPRTMPLAFYHPVHIKKKTKLRLPNIGWNLTGETLHIKDSSFSYTKDSYYNNNVVTVYSQYQSLKNHVHPEQISLHFENIDKIKNNLGYGLHYADQEKSEQEKFADHLNWPIVIIFILIAPLFLFIAWKIYSIKAHVVPNSVLTATGQPKGLGGWLSILFIHIFFLCYSWLSDFYTYLSIILSQNQWMMISNPLSENFYVVRAPLCLVITMTQYALLTVFFLSIIMFFKKKNLFPITCICALGFSLFLSVFISLSTLKLLDEAYTGREIAQDIKTGFWVIIWTCYLLRSKRVKNTFMNPDLKNILSSETSASNESSLSIG